MRLGQQADDVTADAATIVKLADVLIRRGAALHIARVLSWGKHQALAYEITSAVKADAEPGFARISFEQARAYDIVVWRRLAELAQGRVTPGPDGKPPLDDLLEKVFLDQKISRHLVPRQSGQTRQSSSSDNPPADRGRISQQERQIGNLKRQLMLRDGEKAPHSRPKGQFEPVGKRGRPAAIMDKQKDKKQKQQKQPNTGCTLPGLRGMQVRTKAGAAICFKYNLGSCTGAQPGQKCARGIHVCGGCEKPGCAWPACTAKYE